MTALIITADKIGLTGLASWFKETQAKLAHRAKRRATIKQLNQLTDYELRDIGIHRGQIWSIANGDDTIERIRRDCNENLRGWV